MASAKCLTTAELGAARYEAAQKSGLWPIQVRLPRHLDGREHRLHVPDRDPVAFEEDVRGSWRASLAVPEGRFTYEIRSGDELVSTGGLDVRAPQTPITGNRLAATLHARPLSGATQLGNEEAAEADAWPVEFLYEEETWAARDVAVVSDAFKEELALSRGKDGAFRGKTTLAVGDFSYRFCVTPREPTRADQSPFTRLGWDDSQSTPNRLMTWPLTMSVKDLGKKGISPGSTGTEVVKGAEAADSNDGGAEYGTTFASADKSGTAKGTNGTSEGTHPAPGSGRKTSDGSKGQGNGGLLLGAAVALATIACAFGASVTLLLIGRGEGGDDSPGVVLGVEPECMKATEKGVESVLLHARGQSL